MLEMIALNQELERQSNALITFCFKFSRLRVDFKGAGSKGREVILIISISANASKIS